MQKWEYLTIFRDGEINSPATKVKYINGMHIENKEQISSILERIRRARMGISFCR